MPDKPELTAVPLADATPAQRAQLAEAMAQTLATEQLQRTHRCWFPVPTPTEWERLRKYAEAGNKCPQCADGHVVVETYHGSLGDSWHVVCRRGWGGAGCGFKEYVSDDA